MRISWQVAFVLFFFGFATVGAETLEDRRAERISRLNELEAGESGETAAERFHALIDLYLDLTLLERPELATFLGMAGDHGRWTDGSLEAEARRDRHVVRALAVVHKIPRDQLEPRDRLSYDLLEAQLADSIAGQRFSSELLPIDQLRGVQRNIPRILGTMPKRTTAQYEDILSRLCTIAPQVETALERLKQGLAVGVTPPAVTLRAVPDQVESLITEDPFESPVLRAFANMPASVSDEDQARLRAAAAACFTDVVAPAFRSLHGYLAETYLPGARTTIGMSDLPDGEAWYAYNARQFTTTDSTPREIHDIGLAEVARIRAEMDRVIHDSGFEGDFAAWSDFLRTDPQFYFDSADELLAAYRDIAKRADAKLIEQLGHLPRLPYGVEPVPSFAEQAQPTAYYRPGSLEAGRPGVFFANTYNLASRPRWEMEALTLHEAVPGHHLQLSIAQELEEQPWFRRFGGYTAFVEGWGLYAESLGEEMGFYQDPYSKFGQLTYEMWRAIRLVVDTGMHALGWSRQQAIDYFQANTAKAEHDIVVEVDRYIVRPGQALAYKIGELKLQELRTFAEASLGERFDVRAFHDQVLGSGALPLAVLERQIRAWVGEQLDAAATPD